MLSAQLYVDCSSWAVLTADSVFSEEREELKDKVEKTKTDNLNFVDDDNS